MNTYFLPAPYVVGKPHGPGGADPTSRFLMWSWGSAVAQESLVQDAGGISQESSLPPARETLVRVAEG